MSKEPTVYKCSKHGYLDDPPCATCEYDRGHPKGTLTRVLDLSEVPPNQLELFRLYPP